MHDADVMGLTVRTWSALRARSSSAFPPIPLSSVGVVNAKQDGLLDLHNCLRRVLHGPGLKDPRSEDDVENGAEGVDGCGHVEHDLPLRAGLALKGQGHDREEREDSKWNGGGHRGIEEEMRNTGRVG